MPGWNTSRSKFAEVVTLKRPTLTGHRCYCSNSIPAAAAPIPGVVGACLSPCGGDASEMCGGPGTLSIYHNCAGNTTCTNANIGSIEGASTVSPASAASPVSSTTSTTPAPGTGATESKPPSTSSVSQPPANVGVVKQLTTTVNASAVATSTTVPAPAPTPSGVAVVEPSPAETSSDETTSATEPEPSVQMCPAPYV